MTLKNGDRLQRKLSGLASAMQGQVLGNAALAGAEVVKSESKNIVPVDTGNLRASITSELGEVSTHKATAHVGYGKQAPYGKFIELGTSRMSAQPFLRPALVTTRGRAIEEVRNALKRQLETSV